MAHPSSTGPKPPPAALGVAGGIGLVLTLAGLLVGTAPLPGVPRGARALPRVPGPPADARALLRQLGVGSFTWYACALCVPLLWWMAARWPLTQQRSLRSLAFQALGFSGLIAVVSFAHYFVVYHGAPSAPTFAMFAQVALGANILPLLAVSAAANAVEARRRGVQGAIEAERLRAELAESRLLAVTSQLQPHFLFNTLQSISTLIHRDPDAADAMLAKLSDLLRDVLRRSRSALVTLDAELRMTSTYLDLARLRFGERLTVTMDVEPGASAALVPMLLFQPFVENALKHGVGPRAAGGCVGIGVRRESDHLAVSIWDDGVGLAPDWQDGTGLANARERLRHAFGPDQSLIVEPRPGGGTIVTMRMPLRMAGGAEMSVDT